MLDYSKIKKTLGNIAKSLVLPVGILVIGAIMFGEDFVKVNILLTIARTSVMPLFIAMGMSMLMYMGMWDFSVGGVIFASAILGSELMKVVGGGIPVFCLFAIVIGILLMGISGIVYNFMKIPSLVISLGMVILYESLPRLIIPGGFGEIGSRDGFLALSPWIFILFIIGFAIFYYIFNYTTLGHNIRAIGANQQVAYNAGLNLTKVKLTAYIVCGFFAGLASIIFMSMSVKVYAASNLSSVGTIFDSMMGIFIAFFLSKYCGYPLGLVIGTFTMKLLSSLLITAGLSSNMKSTVLGIFLLAVLAVSANQGRFSAMNDRKKVRKLAESEYAGDRSMNHPWN